MNCQDIRKKSLHCLDRGTCKRNAIRWEIQKGRQPCPQALVGLTQSHGFSLASSAGTAQAAGPPCPLEGLSRGSENRGCGEGGGCPWPRWLLGGAGPPSRPGSPQVWQCGGSMEVLPCSRVAHIERTKKPYNNDIDYYAKRNALRAAEVWMDSFKSHVYMAWNIPMSVSWWTGW